MRKHFDDQIAQLGEQMMAMGALVENTIERAIRALQTDDMAEAAAIRDGDHVVDEKEREVEAMCIHMLLQQQPVARDLRTISAALKMITDMERIGDQASDICEIATMGHLRSPRPEHFASMAQAAISMVHRAIDAYVHKDIELPLRYNYDKPEKPRISRVFGYLARFFILFQTEKSSREVVIS